MRRRFIALAPGSSLLEAERLMRIARVRTLPVVHGTALVGVLSNRHLLESSLAPSRASAEALGRFLLETPVEALMDGAPLVLGVETPLAEAARRMLEVGEGCLPVVDGAPPPPARLLGLLTENDLLRAAFEPRAPAPGGLRGPPGDPRRGGLPREF